MRIATRRFVRRMTVADIPQVLEVERESFPTMWPPTAFKRELQQNRIARYILVAEHNPTAPAIEAVPTEIPKSAGPLGRVWDELRAFLGTDAQPALAPLEERQEVVLGFLGVWMPADEAHIVTFGVREAHRRQGIGEQLLISVIELARASGKAIVTLECRVSNEAALALYEKYGFEKVGLRPRYYSDDHEDAYVLSVAYLLTEKYRRSFERLKEAHRRRWGDFAMEEET